MTTTLAELIAWHDNREALCGMLADIAERAADELQQREDAAMHRATVEALKLMDVVLLPLLEITCNIATLSSEGVTMPHPYNEKWKEALTRLRAATGGGDA